MHKYPSYTGWVELEVAKARSRQHTSAGPKTLAWLQPQAPLVVVGKQFHDQASISYATTSSDFPRRESLHNFQLQPQRNLWNTAISSQLRLLSPPQPCLTTMTSCKTLIRRSKTIHQSTGLFSPEDLGMTLNTRPTRSRRAATWTSRTNTTTRNN
jgi:hypothetical protein